MRICFRWEEIRIFMKKRRRSMIWAAGLTARQRRIPSQGLRGRRMRITAPNTMFWPMEIQAQVRSNRTLGMPAPGEMTQQEAAIKAKRAVMERYGEDALASLGEAYFMGYEMFRLEEKGCSRWHVYITDDPVKMENGWEIIFVDSRCTMHTESLEVREISDQGNG